MTGAPSYGVVIPARDEARFLPATLKALAGQTHPPRLVVVVDDGSRDMTAAVAFSRGCLVVRLPRHEESWAGMPQLSRVFNAGVRTLLAADPKLDYFMVLGADTLLEEGYAEALLSYMALRRLVVASGVVRGEPVPRVPRGTGRMFRVGFWRRHVKRFPYCYSWESYPVYKALSLGYRVGVCRHAWMWVQRPTRSYKPLYGFAMRELGYFPPYALLRCLLAFVKDRRAGVNMLRTYLSRSVRVVDKQVARYLRRAQARRMLLLGDGAG